MTLALPFEHRGRCGTITATVHRNEDPARWGFPMGAGEVLIAGPSPLDAVAWRADLPILEPRCPGWRFLPGS